MWGGQVLDDGLQPMLCIGTHTHTHTNKQTNYPPLSLPLSLSLSLSLSRARAAPTHTDVIARTDAQERAGPVRAHARTHAILSCQPEARKHAISRFWFCLAEKRFGRRPP